MEIHDWCRNNSITKKKGCGLDAPSLTVPLPKRKGQQQADVDYSKEFDMPLNEPPGAVALVKGKAKFDFPPECSGDGYIQFVELASTFMQAKLTDEGLGPKLSFVNEMTSKWQTMTYGDGLQCCVDSESSRSENAALQGIATLRGRREDTDALL